MQKKEGGREGGINGQICETSYCVFQPANRCSSQRSSVVIIIFDVFASYPIKWRLDSNIESKPLNNTFFMLILFKRTSFLDTFQVLYFNHYYTLHLQVVPYVWYAAIFWLFYTITISTAWTSIWTSNYT